MDKNRHQTNDIIREAISKANRYCSVQERCVIDIQKKLKQWGVEEVDTDDIIEQLIKDNFLNEERFVDTFVISKFNLNKWGKIKIRYELVIKKIPERLIQSGLDKIDEQEYHSVLKKIILKKKGEIKETDIYKANKKVATFAISKGYEPELVWDVIREYRIM